MRVMIELPDPLYRKGEQLARAQDISMEEFIIRAFERELRAGPDTPSHSKRVTLPLIWSKEPGTLDLRNLNFDDFVA